MSDMVGNPEDRISHNEAQMGSDNCPLNHNWCLNVEFKAPLSLDGFLKIQIL